MSCNYVVQCGGVHMSHIHDMLCAGFGVHKVAAEVWMIVEE